MKRIMSLVLALAMVLSLMAGICIGVSAEGEEYTYIEGASVTGTPIPELAVGDTLPALEYSVPAGANYTVSANWTKNGSNVEAGTAVEAGNVYKLRIIVTANDGYAFDHINNSALLINGEGCAFMGVNSRGEGVEQCWYIKNYAFLTPIEKVEVSYEEPVAGKVLPAATIPAGVNYSVDYGWYDYNNDTDPWQESGAVAQKSGAYEINIDISAADGYQFTDETEVWLNGVKCDNANISYNWVSCFSDCYNLGDPISSVSITYAEPELGKTLPAPAVTGDHCVLDHYYWYDFSVGDYVPADAVAEAGHEYDLEVYVKPAAGYKFTEETALYVNGVQIRDEYYYSIDDSLLYYDSDVYDFTVELSEVSLICAEPEVGKAFPKAEAAADAGYTVETCWYDLYTNEDVTNDTVKDGGIYEMELNVYTKDGYKFAEDVTLTLNGSTVDEEDYGSGENWLDYYKSYSFAKAVDKFEISYELPEVGKAPGAITIPKDANYTLSEDSGWYDYYTDEKVTGNFEDGKRYELRAELVMNFGYVVSESVVVYSNGEKANNYGCGKTAVYIYETYSFADPVAKVELPAWPELKVGDKLPEISGTGEHYSYYVEWYGEDAEGNYLEGDTVVDNAVYYATIYAHPEEGYEFTDDTQITLGGKALSKWSHISYGYIMDMNVYNFGAVKMIEKVELTTDIPGYGEEGGEVEIPENVGYVLESYSWYVSSDDTYEDVNSATKAYTYGDRILLSVQLYTEEGCIFAPDTVITINGKEYEIVSEYQDQYYMHVLFDLGEVTKPAATPATGDTTPVALLSFLCLSTLAGVSVLLNKKRAVR